MCGRFQLDSDIREIIETYKIVEKDIDEYDRGDFYPSQNAPIVVQDKKRALRLAKWGFDLKDNKPLVINARAESIMNKPMFKNSIYSARCIIPVNLFYEWKDEGRIKKVKHGIRLKKKNLFSLGGIYKMYIDENLNKRLAFTIITTEADEAIRDIHSRMPLIIKDSLVDCWLDSNTSIKAIEEIIYSNRSNEFVIERYEGDSTNGYEQLRMF